MFFRKRYVKSISGCNSIYRKKNILDVGGFDLYLSTAEDTKLNDSLLKIGKLLYTPNAVVLHDHRRGLSAFGKRMYQYGYGRAKSGLWDIQVLPAILVLPILASLLFTSLLVLNLFIIYVFLITLMSLKFIKQERNFNYFFSIPLVFFLEHILYILGFWNGLLNINRR